MPKVSKGDGPFWHFFVRKREENKKISKKSTKLKKVMI